MATQPRRPRLGKDTSSVTQAVNQFHYTEEDLHPVTSAYTRRAGKPATKIVNTAMPKKSLLLMMTDFS